MRGESDTAVGTEISETRSYVEPLIRIPVAGRLNKSGVTENFFVPFLLE